MLSKGCWAHGAFDPIPSLDPPPGRRLTLPTGSPPPTDPMEFCAAGEVATVTSTLLQVCVLWLSRLPHPRRSAPCLHPTPKIRSKRRHFRGLHGSQSNHQLRPCMRCRVMRPQPTLSHCRLAQLLQAPWVLPSLGRQALLLHMSRLDHPRSRRGFLCRKLRPNARRIHRRMTKRRHSVCHRPTPYHPNWC